METRIELEKEKGTNVPTCCDGCTRWEKFGKNCFYCWEGKKHCTMYISNWEEAAMQQQL